MALLSTCTQAGPLPIPIPSAFAPVQSPQYRRFKAALGTSDAPAAQITVRATAIGLASHFRHTGAYAITQGSSSGRLLAFAPDSNATASTERLASEPRPD